MSRRRRSGRKDAAACRKIGENCLSLLRPGMGILTHCNAGHLAVSEYGTALAPVYLGEERGYGFKVFADETRPLLQGARLTAYELQKVGVDVTLICDNMASAVMRKGWVQAVVVGCDRVAANGGGGALFLVPPLGGFDRDRRTESQGNYGYVVCFADGS